MKHNLEQDVAREKRADSENYRQLLLSATPMLDLRAPCEFKKGAFAGAVSLPLMDDIQRAKVGTCYKRDGKKAAIKLGHSLVKGELKAQKIAAWRAFIEENPQGFLYCFRGGLRSQTVQHWLAEAGINYPLVKGGYRAMRRFLIEETLRIGEKLPLTILSGYTGVGKTQLLVKVNETVDLEGLANHRGSSFGGKLAGQPTQIAFENELAVQLIKHEEKAYHFILLEDESRLIGARAIPLELHEKMKLSPIILLTLDRQSRMENIRREYVDERLQEYLAANISEPFLKLKESLTGSIKGIKRRLGDERHRQIFKLIESAVSDQQKTNDSSGHLKWIKVLLDEYYDPMYRFQLSKKQQRVIFEGDKVEVNQFISDLRKK